MTETYNYVTKVFMYRKISHAILKQIFRSYEYTFIIAKIWKMEQDAILMGGNQKANKISWSHLFPTQRVKTETKCNRIME